MHRILAIALCMLWSVAGLAADAAMPAQSCASLGEATAGPEDNFRPPLEGEVIVLAVMRVSHCRGGRSVLGAHCFCFCLLMVSKVINCWISDHLILNKLRH